MASKSKGINPSRLTGTFGSEYLAAGTHTLKKAYAFIVQADDTEISTLSGGDANTGVTTDDYLTVMNLTGVALKQGALIQAPAGELFQSITIAEAGAIIVYK